MIEKQLLKLLLNYEFFKEHECRLLRSMFPEGLNRLYETIVEAHKKYKADLSEDEIFMLYKENNPTITTATKMNIEFLITELKEVALPKKDLIADILIGLYRKEMGRQIGTAALDLIDGDTAQIPELKQLIAKLENNIPLQTEVVEVTADIAELIELVKHTTKYSFNLVGLQEVVGGIGPGIFTIIGARPEVGKSAMWISLVAAPGGFLQQGAKVAVFINEEPAIRTKIRLVSALTGKTFHEIQATVEDTKAQCELIRTNLKIYDAVTLTIPQIEGYVEEFQPDIVIIDQLDKVEIAGTFNGTHERLREIYIRTRELGKRFKVAPIAISQLSAEAEGKLNVTLDQFENSRTGKAAEGDLIIGIGKRPSSADGDETIRQINVLKNKVTGLHSHPVVRLRSEISRYEN